MRNTGKILRAAFVAVACAPFAAAQTTTLPFTIRAQAGSTVLSLADGGSIAFQSEGVGLSVDATITLTYLGTGSATATFNNVFLTGSTDFSLSGPELPATVTANTPTLTYTLRYVPSTSRLTTARLQFAYVEGTRIGAFALNLSGSAPEFGFTYQVLPNGNTTLLGPGDTIAFPQTAIDETAAVQVSITNRGTASGVVNGVTLAGSPQFVLAGLPFPPATVDAGKDLRFSIRFTPKQLDAVSGSVRIDLVAGRGLSFNVQGSGLGPVFAYDVIQESSVAALLPNQTVNMPDALVGEKSSTVVRIRNTGNADGRIAVISVSGTGFSVSEVPFTPYVLTPGNAVTFTVNFSPTQPGRAVGKLRVGNDSFDLTANGLGASLVYSYTASGVSFQVQSGNMLVFPPVSVGETSTIRFSVTNNGTAPTAINSISASGPTPATFTLSDLPQLPVQIAPGTVVQFTATFAPTTVGNISGSLRIDTLNFPLSGVASAPAALPDYTFQGASGTVEPAQQPALGLSLGSAYPMALRGTLTLSFNSDVFSNDPAVQFATGGRTIEFNIPAGSRQAVFPNNASQIRVQSGTVAGTISITPSFKTSIGDIDLTPTTPPALVLTVPQQAPRLLNVALSNKTASGFTLLISGYATGRSVTQMDFQFTATPEETLGTTKLSLNVEPSFIAWYQSAQSQPFGSLFTATVPFTLQGDVKKVTNVVETVQSVSVTLTNRQGVSASRSIDLR